MSTLKEFLVSLAGRGIQMYVDDGRLKTKSEPGAITEEIAGYIRENKHALIELLGAAAPQMPALVPVGEGEHGTLSFAQQRIWFLDQFGNGSAQYNMPAALRLTGVLDRGALQSTLDEIVRRHQILRTTYARTASGGVQRISPARTVPLVVEEFAGMAAEEQQGRIRELMQREASIPFDLAADLMIRVCLIGLESDSHILLLTLHHVAMDGWSLGILVKEFVALYQAFVEHRASPLPELEIQYADYAHWQRQAFSGESMQRHLQFWRNALDGIPQLHNLPLDRPRPVSIETAGHSLRSGIDAELLAELKLLASRHGATLFMVLQAALSLLLARWSGDEDIVVGTPVAGRDLRETEGLIGCFINTLVLRSRVAPGMTFEQLLEQSSASTIAAYAHQQIPFEMVVEGLNPPRSMSHTPMFQVMFALQNYEVGALTLPGLVVEELPVDAQSIKFDIAIMATETEEGLRLLWTYVDGLFEPATIDSMASSYRVLLREIARTPEQDSHRLALLDPTQAGELRQRAAQAGHGCLVLDRNGDIQPIGAAGWVSRANPHVAGTQPFREATGEVGRMRADGTVEIIRHVDDNAVLHGHHIATTAIEQALMALGSIESAVVRVRQDAQGKPALVAYVGTPAIGQEALQEEWRDALKSGIPDFMMPAVFMPLRVLPRLPDGGIDFAGLPQPDFSANAKAAPVPPSHALEAQLCEIWCSVLSLESVGVHDNFFDVGGTSLHSIIVQQEILQRAGLEVAITDLFTYPTIAGLARYLQHREQSDTSVQALENHVRTSGAVAIIGMAGRFPQAGDIETFWKNIKDGHESLTVFSDEELLAAGVSPAALNDPAYVKSGVVLDGIREFDAAFFGFTPREAEVTDPQQRLLFECAVEALEEAGYGDDSVARSVGVYLGTGESQYLFEHLLPQSALLESMRLAVMYGNRPDYAATRLSYRLNLCGPSVNVGTACSTSLVAVHQACQSLLGGECEMALAGGASIAQLGPRGYLYQEGGIASPDGHCRAFDRTAAGTRSGSGAALVLLKRLEDALADGDTIHAVIKGSAINNDGADKVGYTAPSVLGQARVISRALAGARVTPDTVQYVEAHGTGTPLGDPIEMRALTQAFGGAPKNQCALSAVKTNIGHLDSAAGVAGLVKAVKALSEGQIPPMVNFHEPNPQIDFDNSPFYVSTALRPWPDSPSPRRAGVSSFGIGGTNAHVVLEQAPEVEAVQVRARPQLVVLSARTDTALASMSSRLVSHLSTRAGQSLADIAYTLQVGRATHARRLAFVADSVGDAAMALSDTQGLRLISSTGDATERPSVVFMFTGQGSQYVGMASGLYRAEPLFRDIVDSCANFLADEMGLDLRRVMFADAGDRDAHETLARTDVAQPALFVLEYALARLLMSWGVSPDAMIGHSLGEYVAACLAGVFKLEDALRLVAARGRLMQAAERGGMLSVALSEQDARALIDGSGCCLAAINGPADCVVSGPLDAIAGLARTLAGRDVSCRELRTSHAFHSQMMEEAALRFGEIIRGVTLSTPSLAYVSNVTGKYILPEEATDANYWVRHLRGTVHFASGIDALVSDTGLLRRNRLFVEVGPGLALTSLLRKNTWMPTVAGIACVRHAQDERDDEAVLLAALGGLWVRGVAIDWRRLHENAQCRRVPLPTYPFERQTYWIERSSLASPSGSGGKLPDTKDWFYVPTWAQLPSEAEPVEHVEEGTWLIFADEGGVGEQLRSRLETRHREVVTVSRGQAFAQTGSGTFEIDPESEQDYRRLMEALDGPQRRSLRVIHLWGVDPCDATDAGQRVRQAEQLGFGSLLYLARNCDKAWPQAEVRIDVVTRQVFSVTGEETMAPEFALALGLCKVIPQEYPQIRVHHVDMGSCLPNETSAQHYSQDQLFAEIASSQHHLHVAHRGRKRWSMRYERSPLPVVPRAPGVRGGGAYVLTGGMGKIGLTLADALARQGAGVIVLVGRTPVPARESWPEICAGADPMKAKIQALLAIEALGAKVVTACADVASYDQMCRMFDDVEREFGRVSGVIHGAGKVHDALRPLDAIDSEVRSEQFSPKVAGTLVLDRVLTGRSPDFCLLMSSISSVLGGLGFGAYAAANSFQDAYAQWKHHQGDHSWQAVNWDGWLFSESARAIDRFSMTPEEGVAAFDLVLGARTPQIVNSTGDLDARIAQWLTVEADPATLKSDHARPALQTTYLAPRNDVERALIGIWQELLGFHEIGIHDNFFELGGDSILITKLLSKMRECPLFEGADLKLKHLFEMPTVAQLSTLTDELRQAAELAAKSESLRARSSVVEEGEI